MAYIRGYITNLGKYNEGYLIGEWVDFPIDDDELQEVFKRIGINEFYEEFFITDFDSDISGVASHFGEYSSIESINEFAERIESMTSYELDILEAVADYFGLDDAFEHDIDDYILYSDINSEYDLGYYWVNEYMIDNLEKMGELQDFIDFEKYGKYIDSCITGGFCKYGYIECVG